MNASELPDPALLDALRQTATSREPTPPELDLETLRQIATTRPAPTKETR